VDRPLRQLDPAVVKVWTVAGAIITLPMLLPGILVLGATGGHVAGWVLVAVAVVVIIVSTLVVPRWRYAHTFWGVDDGVLRVRRGVVFRSHAAVPLFRIQHIDLQQGPIDRWAGLQQLTVHTASPAADVTLPGIDAAEAETLRAELLRMARVAVQRYGVGEASDAV
jgi:membrane protein YdbS with pleckstrin-like domain